ncbi:MAG: ethanolamine utilization protein EutM [Hyphomicrobiales bacterium]|nr:MAG: ethanolamine utilization protein EutM [Hyphomicrobiales bacterium]
MVLPMANRPSKFSFMAAKFAARSRLRLGRNATLVCAAAVLLSACMPSNFGGGGFGGFGSNRQGQGFGGPVQNPSGEVIGNGSVRVALLVPLSANGNAGTIGLAFKNAAALALKDFPNANIQLLVKDTQGTPAGAQAAATAALAQGAELILGPVFGNAVRPVAALAAPRAVPVISFSTRTDVATRGAYLMGFLPRDQVYRAAAYAAQKGKRSFAILVPETPTGLIYEGLFREAAANLGIRIASIARYKLDRTSMQRKATEITKLGSQIDGVFMPDGADSVTFLAQLLSAGGVRAPKVLFVGSGQWDDPKITREPALRGAIYASAPNDRFRQFASKYQQNFSSVPPRNVSLAYDATILAAGLTARFGQQKFATKTLTNRDGFAGVDGVFRFNSDGTNTRAMAVYEVQSKGARVVSPAPSSLSR